NDAGANFNIQTDGSISSGLGTNAFINGGTITKNLTTGVTNVGVNFSGSGAIALATGALSPNGASTPSSLLSGAGAPAFGGGTATLNNGTALTVSHMAMSGVATVKLGRSLGYGGAFSQAVATTVAVGSFTLSLTGAGSTLAGSVTGTGTLAFAGGSQLLTGS